MFVGRRTKYFLPATGDNDQLSGFLKGYALETIRDILHSCSIENALINMGNSSVLALGNHRPERDGKLTLATSRRRKRPGSHRVYFFIMNASLLPENESDGRRHIISPQNGNFVEGIRQIAVVTKNGAVGEILSTALFAAGPEQRETLLASLRPLLVNHFLIGY